jgi:hypothetical protein
MPTKRCAGLIMLDFADSQGLLHDRHALADLGDACPGAALHLAQRP